MVKRSSKGGRVDINELASSIMVEATGEVPLGGKNPAAVALGHLGGKKGGLARAKKLTSEQRKSIAQKAAQARWANRIGGAENG